MVGDTIILNCEITNEFKEYLSDLIEYGLTKYKANYSGVSDLFLLWNDYSKSQVQLKRCVNPGDINSGTFYGTEGDVYIFASIPAFFFANIFNVSTSTYPSIRIISFSAFLMIDVIKLNA